MSDLCVVIPTYNEAENIAAMIKELNESINEKLSIIVVDDNSPDGTSDIANKLNEQYKNIIVHTRSGKLGIGSAIIEGMKKALDQPDCKYIITMDADFSHNPRDIPRLVDEARSKNVDMVQGSRYIKGGKIVGWGLYRKIQSQTANYMAKFLLGLKTYEITTYFRVYTKRCAEIVVKNARSNKYEFAIDSALIIKDNKFNVAEVPITFVDRTQGKSKLKKSDVFGWIGFVVKTYFSRALQD